MRDTVLLCTVGGSHEPVLEAIKSSGPRYVCFICSGRDPVTARPGSIGQIVGAGNVIKKHRDDKTPSLPNIPTQARLADGSFEVWEVPADDLDKAFLIIRQGISELATRFPGAVMVADYTGGTKTMTAALVAVALESDDVELQLVTGPRSDIRSVKSGTERAVGASVNRVRIDRAMAVHLDAWGRFAYREAAHGLDRIKVAADAPDRPRLELARAMSHGFASWDDFDHGGALDRLEVFAARIAPDHPKMLGTIRLLSRQGDDDPKVAAARLFDLWLNAKRRAERGRYDDAIARVYRLIEWTAQWQLRTKLGVNTSDLPRSMVPTGVGPAFGRDGKIQVGLQHAWQVVREQMDGPAGDFVAEHGNSMRNLLQKRNHSILAHGFHPVKRQDWRDVHSWMRDLFLPLLGKLALEVGLREAPPQLPTRPPKSIVETGSGGVPPSPGSRRNSGTP